MQHKKTDKKQTTSRRPQSPQIIVETVSPPIQANVEPPKVQQATIQSQYGDQVTKPRKFALWMQTWLPIILNALILIVIMGHAFYFQMQWDAMKVALKETRVSRELDSRAWV